MRTNYGIAAGVMLSCLAAFSIRPQPGNPRVQPSRTLQAKLNPPPQVSHLLEHSCADCHSSQTRWPWYSRVEPMASLVHRDVVRGRKVMNFSDWPDGVKGAGLLLAACSALETGHMPKSPYRYLHPGSTPSQADVRAFCGWSHDEALRTMTAARRKAQ